jgi:hypothetical protein
MWVNKDAPNIDINEKSNDDNDDDEDKSSENKKHSQKQLIKENFADVSNDNKNRLKIKVQRQINVGDDSSKKNLIKSVTSPHLNIDPAGPFKSATLNEVSKMRAHWRKEPVKYVRCHIKNNRPHLWTWFKKIDWISPMGFKDVCDEYYMGDHHKYIWNPYHVKYDMRKEHTIYFAIVNCLDMINAEIELTNELELEIALYNLQDRMQLLSLKMESNFIYSDELIINNSNKMDSLLFDFGMHVQPQFDENQLPDLDIHVLYCKFWGDIVDIPITHVGVLKLMKIFDKCTPAPCQSRSVTDVIPETWDEPGNEVVFSCILRILVASLLGIYDHCKVRSSYRLRRKIYDMFSLNDDYENAEKKTSASYPLSNRINTIKHWMSNNKFFIIYSIREFILVAIDSLSGLKSYMEDNYYWHAMESNCFSAMDKMRQLMNEQLSTQNTIHPFFSSEGELIMEQWNREYMFYGKQSNIKMENMFSNDKPSSTPLHINDGIFRLLRPIFTKYNEENLACSYRPINEPFVDIILSTMNKIEEDDINEQTNKKKQYTSKKDNSNQPAKRGRPPKNTSIDVCNNTSNPTKKPTTVDMSKMNLSRTDIYFIQKLTKLSLLAGDNTSIEWATQHAKVAVSSTMFILEAQQLYESETMRSGIKNVCDYLYKYDTRSFYVLKMIYSIIYKHKSVHIYNLPWYITEKQIELYRKMYGVKSGEPLPSEAGLFYYCENCCEFKSNIVPNALSITHRDEIKSQTKDTPDDQITSPNSKKKKEKYVKKNKKNEDDDTDDDDDENTSENSILSTNMKQFIDFTIQSKNKDSTVDGSKKQNDKDYNTMFRWDDNFHMKKNEKSIDKTTEESMIYSFIEEQKKLNEQLKEKEQREMSQKSTIVSSHVSLFKIPESPKLSNQMKKQQEKSPLGKDVIDKYISENSFDEIAKDRYKIKARPKIKMIYDDNFDKTGVMSSIADINKKKYETSVVSSPSVVRKQTNDYDLATDDILKKSKTKNKKRKRSEINNSVIDNLSNTNTDENDKKQDIDDDHYSNSQSTKKQSTALPSKLSSRAPGNRRRGRKPDQKKKKRDVETLFHNDICIDVFSGKLHCAKNIPKVKKIIDKDIVNNIIGKSSKERKASSINREYKNIEDAVTCNCTELTPINMIGRVLCVRNKDNDKSGSIFICPYCNKNTFYSRESIIYGNGKTSCGCQATLPNEIYRCCICKRAIKSQLNLNIHPIYDDETDPINPKVKMMIFCQDHNHPEIKRWNRTFIRLSTLKYAIRNRLYSKEMSNGDRQWDQKKKIFHHTDRYAYKRKSDYMRKYCARRVKTLQQKKKYVMPIEYDDNPENHPVSIAFAMEIKKKKKNALKDRNN